MSVTRILGIAPYEGMRNLMMHIAAGVPNVALTAFVGNLEPGAEIAERYADQNFDVILSRGGTAELILNKTTLPVVDIKLSMYDILRAIRLAEGNNSHYAIVGFPSITNSAYILCDMLKLDVELHTIHNEDEAHVVLKKLADAGCPMVLCDTVTKSLAQKYSIPALLITSGSESVEAAIHQAVSIGQTFLSQKEHAHLLEAALSSAAGNIIIADEDGHEVFSGLKEEIPSIVRNRLQANHSITMSEGSRRTVITVKEKQYILNSRLISTHDRRYVSTVVQTSSIRPILEKEGIRLLNSDEVKAQLSNSFYGTTQFSDVQFYDRYANSSAALMLTGETGSGNDQIARLIYCRGPFQHAPICIIDCALLQKKGREYLLNNEASPFADIGVTVNFINIESLKEEWFTELFRTIRDTDFHKRNKLMFCCTLHEGKGLSAQCRKLVDWFGCTVVELPPLRSHRDDIPRLASLYLGLLNMRNSHEIVGFEPEALRLLENYAWPANYDQFRRVLQELALLCESHCITESMVRHVLEREERMYLCQSGSQLADILRGKTLEEIGYIAMNFALNECNGNQRAAAAQLGVSRTTLWRMMQKENTTKAYNLPLSNEPKE